MFSTMLVSLTLQVWKYQISIIGSTTMDEAWERLATCREQGCVALSCGGPTITAIRGGGCFFFKLSCCVGNV